ncbi:MAG: hypothetical protein ACRDPW_07885, partial [Mycobacteriales bacterium]
DAVASHRSAAGALGLGDLFHDTHEFYVTSRRQLRRSDIHARVSVALPREDWSVVDGLPVTTARRTVADLLQNSEDESAIARICQDAIRAGMLIRTDLELIVADHIAAYGAASVNAMTTALAGVPTDRQW